MTAPTPEKLAEHRRVIEEAKRQDASLCTAYRLTELEFTDLLDAAEQWNDPDHDCVWHAHYKAALPAVSEMRGRIADLEKRLVDERYAFKVFKEANQCGSERIADLERKLAERTAELEEERDLRNRSFADD